MTPIDALLNIYLLLFLEHVLIEALLQRFVRQVDAQLLERVGLEALKPIDVEDSNRSGSGFGGVWAAHRPRRAAAATDTSYPLVHARDDVFKEL